jgi:hypothetical protein
VATLAEKRNFSNQELAMVAPVNFVAVQAVLRYGRMLKCERSSLFGVTLVTKIVYRVSLHHPWSKASMDFMAITAFYPAFIHRMMGLFVLLGPDVLVAGIAEIGLPSLQRLIRRPMNGMAVVARYISGFMFAHIPGGQMLRRFMTGKAFRYPCSQINAPIENDNGHPFASAFFNMLGTRAMTGFAPFPIRGISGNRFFAMNRFGEPFVIGLMAILAGFRTRILRIPSYNFRRAEDE